MASVAHQATTKDYKQKASAAAAVVPGADAAASTLAAAGARAALTAAVMVGQAVIKATSRAALECITSAWVASPPARELVAQLILALTDCFGETRLVPHVPSLS